MPARDAMRTWFRRARLGEGFRAARDPDLDGWTLAGPQGVVADRLRAASTPWRRVRGLLGRDRMEPGEALLVHPCHQVHTIGMHFDIDVVFCDKDLDVLEVRTLRPGKMTGYVRHSWCVIELPAGTAERSGVEPGVHLELVPPPGSSPS